ncbi:Phosphoinositide phospholipase C [Dirofilaria immitis]|nr:Phosphoinositide phospholipase C [Dirofilaria immitis]
MSRTQLYEYRLFGSYLGKNISEINNILKIVIDKEDCDDAIKLFAKHGTTMRRVKRGKIGQAKLIFLSNGNKYLQYYTSGYSRIIPPRQKRDKKDAKMLDFNEKQWIIDKFHEADVNQTDKINFDKVWRLLDEMNLGIDENYAKALFQNAGAKKYNSGWKQIAYLDQEGFLRFLCY